MNNEFTSKQIVRGTAITSSLTLVSRLLGFVRDLIIARVFGTSVFADAYFVAFRIPNLLRSFVAEGALTSAFVPIFSRAVREGHTSARAAFAATYSFIMLVTGAISLLGIMLAPWIIGVIAPGFAEESQELAVLLLQIMMPFITCVSLVAMINGALSTLKTFGASSMAQVVMNCVLIVGGIVASQLEPRAGVIVLSVSVLIGGVVQVLYQLPALKRAGLALSWGLRGGASVIRQIVSLMIPAIVGATAYQLMIFISTMLASFLPQGSISWLYYADRIVQLPLGIFSVALASVMLPALSSSAEASDEEGFARNLNNGLRYNSFVLIPLSFLIFYSADDALTVLLLRGEFNSYSLSQTALAVKAMSLGIWISSCYSLFARASIARRDTRTPTYIGILSLIVSVLLSIVLMGPLAVSERSNQASVLANLIISIQESMGTILPLASLGHVGLALASPLAALVSLLIITALITGREPLFSLKPFLHASWIATCAASCALFILDFFTPAETTPLIRLVLLGAIAPPTYLAISFVFGSGEARECVQLIWNRVRNRLPSRL